MGSGAFGVQIDQLYRHAETVAGLAAETRAAAGTAQAALGGNAFGVVGQFLATALLDASGVTKEAIGKAAGTVADVHDGLLSSAAIYQENDRRYARAFGGVEEGR